MRLWLSEADKSRFINPVWDVIEKDPEDVLDYTSLKKLPNRSDIIKWVNSGAADKYKIDWSKFDPKKKQSWDCSDVAEEIIQPFLDYQSDKQKKADPKNMFSNKEDFLILDENSHYLFVGVLTYQGAIFCDSFQCGGAGAKWCIGYEKTDRYWIDYVAKRNKRFVLVFNKKVYGDEFNQKYMLEISETDCRGWDQKDQPEDTLSTMACMDEFGFSQKQLNNWYKTLENKVKVDCKDSFSIAAIFAGEQAVIGNDVQFVKLTDFDCTEFNYGIILENVRLGELVFEMISDGEGRDLHLSEVKMGAANAKEFAKFKSKTFLPHLKLKNYNRIVIDDLWIGDPVLDFLSCKEVIIGTLHVPSGYASDSIDANQILQDVSHETGTILLYDSESKVINGVKYFPKKNVCEQYPMWITEGEGASAIITKYMVRNAVNGRKDAELLTGYKRAFIDFDCNPQFFTKGKFDLSLVVSNVPKSNRIYCLNVPSKCKVTYKAHPETDLEILYTDCTPSNLSEKRYRFKRAF